MKAMGGVRVVVTVLLAVAAVVGIWQLLVVVLDQPTLIFPSPTEVWESIKLHWGSLVHHAGVTFGATLLAFAISGGIGVLLAVVMTQWRQVRRLVFPIIVALQAAPKIALAPLLVIWVGFGTKTAVLIGVLIAVFPVIVNTAAGLETVESDLVNLARTMQSGRARLFLRIRFPYALPHIISGLKSAIVLAVVGIVVGEFTGANAGLGFLMLTASANFDTPFAFAALVFLTTGSLVLFYLLQGLERRFAWYRREMDQVGATELVA
ncbi:MAG: ABC transporter permease [Actinomycetota bacterium]